MMRAKTRGELLTSGYQPTPVKLEMRRNLRRAISTGRPLFSGIVGYEDTVFPQIQNALLAQQDFLLLGLRGQAKTRILRQLVELLDEAIPYLAGSEVHDDPLQPISAYGRDLVASQGDNAPIAWLGRDERYQEKLATPDTTVADLLGEIDWARHLEGRSLSDERLLHFGLIPRAHRGIFCLNELPDLSPRIQVALFNILEERDVQIRGFPLRLPLDLCLVFSANPEDYTNRGRIVTPLKDRLGSVIETHYPRSRAEGVAIIRANAALERESLPLHFPDFLLDAVEEFVRQARRHPAVNAASGVSVRLSITAAEVLASNAERRALLLGESEAVPRISDLPSIDAAARGKIELALTEEGEEASLFEKLRSAAVHAVFLERCGNLELGPLVQPFQLGQTFVASDRLGSAAYLVAEARLPALRSAVDDLVGPGASPARRASALEFVLEGLTQLGLLRKVVLPGEARYLNPL